MAVQVKAKNVSCPKCHECEQTYEIWSITCPTCYHTFQVDRYFVSSRKI